LFVWGTNLIARAPQQQQEAVMARINRVDLTYQITVIIAGLCLLTLGRTAA